MKVVFTVDGMSLGEIATRLMERAARPRLRNYIIRADTGERSYRVLRDRLGDPYRVYREVWRHRPGRGFVERQARKENLRRLMTTSAPGEQAAQ